jgi:AraC family transcriptional regulator
MSAEPSIDGVAGALAGIEVDWLFTNPSFGITKWDCHCGRKGMSDERIQLWHVISFVHVGAFVLHCEGQSELVDRTTAILFNPATAYQSTHPFGCSDHGSALAVRREVLLDVMSHYDPAAAERPAGLFTSVLCRDLSRVYLRYRMLVRGLAGGAAPEDPFFLEEAVLEILGDVVRSSSRSGRAINRESARARRRYVQDAQSLLQERFRERYRLEDVARELYVSPFHLCRLFKQETGMSIHRYVNRLRLREALEGLVDGVDLTQLALSLGFSCHSHFTNAFRKEFGMPPGEARRLVGKPKLAEMKKGLE